VIEIRDSRGNLLARGDTIDSCIRSLVESIERYAEIVALQQEQIVNRSRVRLLTTAGSGC
jgi:hypothetical protein